MNTPRSTTDVAPLDLETMRASADRLLAGDAELPNPEELETLTLQLRGHIMLAIPDVERVAARLPEDAVPRACALACIGEARMRLGLEPGCTLPAGIAHAQRLARSVNALCDHYENLGAGRTHSGQSGERAAPEQEAFVELADHCVTASCCRPVWVDEQPIHRECATAEELYQKWQQARRAVGAGTPSGGVGRRR